METRDFGPYVVWKQGVCRVYYVGVCKCERCNVGIVTRATLEEVALMRDVATAEKLKQNLRNTVFNTGIDGKSLIIAFHL